MIETKAIIKPLSIGAAAFSAFLGSSLWYSPLLFGRQFLELSGFTTAPKPSGFAIAAELLRNVLLASVIAWLMAQTQRTQLRSVLTFAIILWAGFPLTLLSGSVMWQNLAPQLALIHAGDWLFKILVMSIIPWLRTRKSERPSSASSPATAIGRALHRG